MPRKMIKKTQKKAQTPKSAKVLKKVPIKTFRKAPKTHFVRLDGMGTKQERVDAPKKRFPKKLSKKTST